MLALEGGQPVRAEKLPIFRLTLERDDIAAVEDVLLSGQISRGEWPSIFERALSGYLSPDLSVGSAVVANGTDALLLAQLAGEVKGGEVIAPSLTFIATVSTIIQSGARVVFAEIDPATGLLDPVDVERKLSSRTRAVVTVDYAGQVSALSELRTLLSGRNVLLIEDAAHSIGAVDGEKKIGAIADLTTFSFFATKNITSGEGGAVTSNNLEFIDRIRRLRAHGILYEPGPRVSGCYDVEELGYNSHLSNLNIALAHNQLRKLTTKISMRKRAADVYRQALRDLEQRELLKLPVQRRDHVYHLFCVSLNLQRLKVPRAQVVSALHAEGIECGIYYRPIHLFSYFQEHYQTSLGLLPATEAFCESLLTLPLFPEISSQEINDVADGLKKVLEAYQE